MQAWTDEDLGTEFEQRLDGLLVEFCPDWRHPELPEPYSSNQRFVAYHRRNANRRHLGDLLTAQPEVAAAVASRVLAAIVCDEDVAANKELIYPMLAAIGRRRVQRYLIAVIETGPEHKKVGAVRAWYWSQVSLVYESVEDLRARRPTATSRAADDEMADLRGLYRIACLTAFVTCPHAATREWLARGTILKDAYYPANLRDLVAQARAIAEEDPRRYKDLLAREVDGTNMAQLGFEDP
ncbi:hypothetical protein [Micromonospora carbonacea]|uniref:hypothetical protein n=1 Tax=Micromonospora carbonacea TaxID=47853 RepID=UPI0009458B13|nr:hypothetical protein [Micromonospora carbonacea]